MKVDSRFVLFAVRLSQSSVYSREFRIEDLAENPVDWLVSVTFPGLTEVPDSATYSFPPFSGKDSIIFVLPGNTLEDVLPAIESAGLREDRLVFLDSNEELLDFVNTLSAEGSLYSLGDADDTHVLYVDYLATPGLNSYVADNGLVFSVDNPDTEELEFGVPVPLTGDVLYTLIVEYLETVGTLD